ncbi:MAG: hypothetical protein AB7N29_10400 [Vicinamibacterales bacterium]
MRIPFALLFAVVPMLTPLPQAPPSPAAAPPKPFDCSAPEYRQFDFWVGAWDVVPNPATIPPGTPPPPAGAKPARNVVEKAHNGCVLIENWTTTGQTGQSFNLYDRASRRWHQTWVDNGGGLHEYWGALTGGNMVFAGEVPLGPGSRFAGRRTVRLTFFPMGPDKVRQFSEALNMDGTWSVNYDLIYTRRAPAK